jgi:iron complex outermembrane receptor protein
VPGISVLTGKVRIRGLEFEAAGRFTRALSLTAQMSLMDPRIVADTPATAGNRPPRAARRTASFWGRYDLAQAPGAWLGLGVFHHGAFYLASNNRLEVPGYTVMDAAAGYRLAKGVELQANLYNLTDRRYYIDAASFPFGVNFVGAYPGAPRSFRVSLRAEF